MNNVITSSFSTGEYHGYNVKYSPFRKNLLACASSEYYGLSGGGRLFIFDVQNPKEVRILATRDYQDGLFCVTWSEVNPHLIVTGSGNGTVCIWDYTTSSTPVAFYKIHEKEVYSVDWCPQNAYTNILTASWDLSVKVYNPFNAKEVGSFREHTDQVHEACWSRTCPEIFASASADRTLRLWDIRTPRHATGLYAHDSEVLCCDWSRMDPDILATGTTSGNIFEWDVRKPNEPLFLLYGHEFAIRRLKFSPFERGRLASVSYDFTTRFWNWNVNHPLQTNKQHTEFVYGLDYSPLKKNQACDCGWDSLLFLYNELV